MVMQLQFYVLFSVVWVSLPPTTAKLNFPQNSWEEPPQHLCAPVNSKQPGTTFFGHVFAWKLYQTVVIVHTPIQKIIMVNMVNTSLWYDSMPNKSSALSIDVIIYAYNSKCRGLESPGNRELKQPRFWATHVNRKWGIFPFNMPWWYKICIP